MNMMMAGGAGLVAGAANRDQHRRYVQEVKKLAVETLVEYKEDTTSLTERIADTDRISEIDEIFASLAAEINKSYLNKIKVYEEEQKSFLDKDLGDWTGKVVYTMVGIITVSILFYSMYLLVFQ